MRTAIPDGSTKILEKYNVVFTVDSQGQMYALLLDWSKYTTMWSCTRAYI